MWCSSVSHAGAILLLSHLSLLLSLSPVTAKENLYVTGDEPDYNHKTGDELNIAFVTQYIPQRDGGREQPTSCRKCIVALQNQEPLDYFCKVGCILPGDIKSEVPMYKRLFDSAQKSHPGCKTVLLTDSTTQVDKEWEKSAGATVYRSREDLNPKDVVGLRLKLWADYAAHLIAIGESYHLVILDDDILVVGDVSHVFAMRILPDGRITPNPKLGGSPFVAAFTYRNYKAMPLNTGVVFVHGGDMLAGCKFLDELQNKALTGYHSPNFWFTDQYAARDLLDLRPINFSTMADLADRAKDSNAVKHTVGGKDRVRILLLPVSRYNWYHIAYQTLKTIEIDDVRVIHFKDGLKKFMLPMWYKILDGKTLYQALKEAWDEESRVK